MRDAVPNLYEHWIAGNVISYIRAALGDLSRSNVLQIINRPKRYVSRDALEGQQVSWESVKSFYQDKNWMMDRIEQLEYDLAMLRNMAPAAAVNYIRKAVEYDEYIREYAQSSRRNSLRYWTSFRRAQPALRRMNTGLSIWRNTRNSLRNRRQTGMRSARASAL